MLLKVKNANIFPLPCDSHSPARFLHLGTIGYGLREFIVMLCVAGEKKGNCYIEEVVLTTVDWTEDVFANCKFVDDGDLADDLAAFAEERDLINMKKVAEVLQDTGNFKWLSGQGLLT